MIRIVYELRVGELDIDQERWNPKKLQYAQLNTQKSRQILFLNLKFLRILLTMKPHNFQTSYSHNFSSSQRRLVLGTAQLGLPYGIANQTGQPDQNIATAIIHEAWKNGIREFDTAQAYGNSEQALGKALGELGISSEAKIITKLHPNLDHLDASVLSNTLNQSLERLGVSSLFGIMLHREEINADILSARKELVGFTPIEVAV